MALTLMMSNIASAEDIYLAKIDANSVTRSILVNDNDSPIDSVLPENFTEKELVNKCADDVQCTEAEHQLNRRSEFIITAL